MLYNAFYCISNIGKFDTIEREAGSFKSAKKSMAKSLSKTYEVNKNDVLIIGLNLSDKSMNIIKQGA